MLAAFLVFLLIYTADISLHNGRDGLLTKKGISSL
uniref:Uncharacterized protein n=1 Tax=Arundo donax TaxID=35708 RepID=A0A0A9BWD3_ARUDO